MAVRIAKPTAGASTPRVLTLARAWTAIAVTAASPASTSTNAKRTRCCADLTASAAIFPVDTSAPADAGTVRTRDVASVSKSR